MLIPALFYLGLSLAILVALSLMILRIGTLLSDCPQRGRIIHAAAVTIATGFAAIGLGCVVLIGAVLPLFANDLMITVPLAVGFSALCLGLGFSNAIATLRQVGLGPDQAPVPAA